jgi:hypothetical protein
MAGLLGMMPIDLARPKINNADGSFSTERTITIEADGRHYLIPTIVGGRQHSPDDAINLWKSGKNNHVGDFGSAQEAESAAVARSKQIGQVRGKPMGLLDGLNDPMAMGLLGAGAALLQPRRVGFGDAINAFQQHAVGTQGRNEARRMHDAQLENILAQAAQRKALAAKGIDGTAPSNIREWQEFQRMSPEQQAQYINMKRASVYKEIEGVQNQMPALPGQAPRPLTTVEREAQARAFIRGSEQNAVETEKARFNFVDGYDDATQRPVQRNVLGMVNQSSPRFPNYDPSRAAPNAGMGNRFLDAYRAQGGTPEQLAQAEGEIGGIRTPGAPQGGAPGMFPKGPTPRVAASNRAREEGNTQWLKSTYQPVVDSDAKAGDMLTSVGVARQAMQGLGTTGWGAEAQTKAASVLGRLGFENAKEYAANSEVFQQAAMSRLWTTLNDAKGPQTEGDAARAAQTFAKLTNTPKANEFILDLAQATAERDKIKANFYRQMYPKVRDGDGDLTGVDRLWSQHAPSIWSNPNMKKWGVK